MGTSWEQCMDIHENTTGITDTLHIDGMPAVSVAVYVCHMLWWLKCHMGAIYYTQHTWEARNDVEIPSHPLPAGQCIWHSNVVMCSHISAVQDLLQAPALACLGNAHKVRDRKSTR